ncbi:SDR family NAD(P)-dependent oxidoreductase [Synechococcus sp. KORDI-52]|uniref:SDR family NAD(P)-dependent oxidoreductase n=1 Tax=Synechococcus sp. KORDI-52 TaxID=585425 RepID=UPI0008FFDD74|nr:SDR family oxidoreductase [Synechococcus sp. KORDI-52]
MARISLITGCGRGIGLSCAEKFFENNPDGKILGISRSKTKEVQDLQDRYADQFFFKALDINRHLEVNSLITQFQEVNGQIDCAICNAGMRSRISIKDALIDTYRQVLETNTISQINIVKHLASTRENNSKPLSILVISSIVGQRGFVDLSTYGVSKSALEGFIKSAAVELASDNILINSLNPGFAKSSYETAFKENKKELYEWTLEQTPLKRWGECREIAEMAMFLISEKNSYMTGSVIYCDGGWTSK